MADPGLWNVTVLAANSAGPVHITRAGGGEAKAFGGIFVDTAQTISVSAFDSITTASGTLIHSVSVQSANTLSAPPVAGVGLANGLYVSLSGNSAGKTFVYYR